MRVGWGRDWRRIGPGGRRQGGRHGLAMGKALGMSGISRLKGGLTLGLYLGSLTGMYYAWGQQTQAGVVVLVVVPGEERLGPGTRIGQAAEESRKARMIFEGLELGLRIRIVVGDMRPRMAVAHAQISQEPSYLICSMANNAAIRGKLLVILLFVTKSYV